MERPWTIRIVVWIMCLKPVALLALLSFYGYVFESDEPGFPVQFTVIASLMILGIAIFPYLGYKLYHGVNWARITILCVTTASILAALFSFLYVENIQIILALILYLFYVEVLLSVRTSRLWCKRELYE